MKVSFTPDQENIRIRTEPGLKNTFCRLVLSLVFSMSHWWLFLLIHLYVTCDFFRWNLWLTKPQTASGIHSSCTGRTLQSLELWTSNISATLVHNQRRNDVISFDTDVTFGCKMPAKPAAPDVSVAGRARRRFAHRSRWVRATNSGTLIPLRFPQSFSTHSVIIAQALLSICLCLLQISRKCWEQMLIMAVQCLFAWWTLLQLFDVVLIVICSSSIRTSKPLSVSMCFVRGQSIVVVWPLHMSIVDVHWDVQLQEVFSCRKSL